MLIAQGLEHAADHSDIVTLALAVLAASGVAIREILTYLAKQKSGEQTPGELARRLDGLETRVESSESRSREVRDIVVSVRAIVERGQKK
jgi:hypothetical protein